MSASYRVRSDDPLMHVAVQMILRTCETAIFSAIFAVERCASACRLRCVHHGRLLSADTNRSACTQAKVTISDFLGAYSSRSWR